MLHTFCCILLSNFLFEPHIYNCVERGGGRASGVSIGSTIGMKEEVVLVVVGRQRLWPSDRKWQLRVFVCESCASMCLCGGGWWLPVVLVNDVVLFKRVCFAVLVVDARWRWGSNNRLLLLVYL